MNRQTQKFFRLAIESIKYSWESKITLWEFTVRYSYWAIDILKDSQEIWIISSWNIYINNLFTRLQFYRSISKNLWTLTDVVSKRISELRDNRDKSDREKRDFENKLEASEKKVSELESTVECLRKEKDDLADKLAKVIVDAASEPDETQSLKKRRNNR